MASLDGERLQRVEEAEGSKKKELNGLKERKKSKKNSYMPKLSCLRIEHDATGKSFDLEVVDASGQRPHPTHLIIMVNGLIGSDRDWKFAAKQFLMRHPYDIIVHCSECNSSMLTFDGIDVMGERLAGEVISVIKRHPGVQKISFIGHSLGGLVARYAIAKLYERDISKEIARENGHSGSHNSDPARHKRKSEGKIAGLEPLNFITSATPHLGSRGHKQVPVLCGFHSLEKAATRFSWFLGKTGRHLFLADKDKGKPPLLVQMVYDNEDMKFLSALQSFKRRVAYANNLPRHEKYPHIVNVEAANPTNFPEEVLAETNVNGPDKIDLEEEMIRGLTKMSWDRIDVSFSGSRQKYLAHNTIQVKFHCINSAGADVIQHMIDNFEL
ncbi:putative lipase ROG1 isoform X2 [Prosopis cineraria]|uniref:putative lipase ROG1 isoform X2 n=1 Tax=Prosopis cineraria TaxID=364024 RepID=UPI00240F4021|nr:putative lipase ROG1 isoform X2 [Prosopis cineraria]XP_054793612.1 putative lipase ROG1 isoform X2 [Prosopis cineraria]